MNYIKWKNKWIALSVFVTAYPLLNPLVKEFRKSTNICQSYEQIISLVFFWLTVYLDACINTESQEQYTQQ